MNDKVVKIDFNIWANDEAEGEALKQMIVSFIDWHGQQGVKITADKLIKAIGMWNKNPFVRSSIINYFK